MRAARLRDYLGWFAMATGHGLTPLALTPQPGGGGTGELVGTATYKGAAAGKYAIPSTNRRHCTTGGHFTAMATIEADFDAGADKSSIALSGTIGNFMTGSMSRDWTVKLMADSDNKTDAPGLQPFGGLGEALTGTDASLATEWSMGAGAATAGGEWIPTFHHKDAPSPNAIPDAVTGTFNAMGSIGNLQGAFGANKVME